MSKEIQVQGAASARGRNGYFTPRSVWVSSFPEQVEVSIESSRGAKSPTCMFRVSPETARAIAHSIVHVAGEVDHSKTRLVALSEAQYYVILDALGFQQEEKQQDLHDGYVDEENVELVNGIIDEAGDVMTHLREEWTGEKAEQTAGVSA